MRAGCLMVQGTTSDAGKSVLVAAIGRILHRHGISCAPFKPQNMALNSAVTAEGGEIGRAQAVQAQACGVPPSTDMNPILLKPNSDTGSQVILLGQSIGNMHALQYHQHKPQLLQTVLQAFERLQQRHGVVLIEGAGSPAEINLRQHDLANMGFAEAADCPVILIADIDRGGVFAHLYGTLALLSPSEQARVKGFVINRFRGDPKLLQSGLEWLEAKTGKPVLGVIPYLHDLHIEAEDALNRSQRTSQEAKLRVAVLMYPRASNHTDFDVLRLEPRIDCQFVRQVQDFKGADLIILPGSKAVRPDLHWLQAQGWPALIQRHLRLGGKLLGICGGYQILGEQLQDPLGLESPPGSDPGLGYLNLITELRPQKRLLQVQGHCLGSEQRVKGYEIHQGHSQGEALNRPLFTLEYGPEGTRNSDDSVRGSYLHGLLDQPGMLNWLSQWVLGQNLEDQNLEDQNPNATPFDYAQWQEREIERLADAVEASIGLEQWRQLLQLPDGCTQP